MTTDRCPLLQFSPANFFTGSLLHSYSCRIFQRIPPA
jgi:hypothetical protein